MRIIGNGLKNPEVADYSPLVIPPNALIAMLQEKKVIEPVYPTIYSFTATAEIAQDIIKDTLSKLKREYPDLKSNYWILNWPEVDTLFSDEDIRADLYRQLYLIGMQNSLIKDQIIHILQMSQKAELYYTWKEGMCFSYSTKAKSVARSALLALEKKYSPVPAMDLANEIQKIDTPMEIIDYQKGTHHTRLMSFWSGIRYQESPVFGSRQSLLLGGAIYHQELGDHSFNAMQRGTYVDFGKIELDLVNDENDRLVINDWHLTALKIRKIKARRHYIPPLKLGLGFTVLEMSRLNWLSSNNKTLLVAGEVFSSLVSSRLNLDYLNMSIGAGVESPWTQKDDWRDKLYNKNRVIDFSAKMDGLLTFGEDRNAQLRGDIAYHYRLDELDSSSQYQLDEILTAKLGFQWRLPEFHQTELLLIGGVSYGDTFRKNADGNEIKQISLQVGLEMNRW